MSTQPMAMLAASAPVRPSAAVTCCGLRAYGPLGFSSGGILSFPIINKVGDRPGLRDGGAMLDEVGPKLKIGVRMLSETVRADARERDIGMQLGEIAKANPEVAISRSNEAGHRSSHPETFQDIASAHAFIISHDILPRACFARVKSLAMSARLHRSKDTGRNPSLDHPVGAASKVAGISRPCSGVAAAGQAHRKDRTFA